MRRHFWKKNIRENVSVKESIMLHINDLCIIIVAHSFLEISPTAKVDAVECGMNGIIRYLHYRFHLKAETLSTLFQGELFI
jgi:hypothetical protein